MMRVSWNEEVIKAMDAPLTAREIDGHPEFLECFDEPEFEPWLDRSGEPLLLFDPVDAWEACSNLMFTRIWLLGQGLHGPALSKWVLDDFSQTQKGRN